MKAKEIISFDPAAFLAEPGPGKLLADYQKNQQIFSQGDPADSIFHIQKGKVKLSVVSARGKEAVTAILGPNDFFGESCLAGQTRRTASATAMFHSAIMRLNKDDVVALLHAEPAFAKVLLHHALARNIRIEEDLVDQLFNSSEKRLARVLLLLANFEHEGQTEVVIPKISQELLAEIVGTTRSRISFFMNRFRDLRFVEYNGHLLVRSSLFSIVA